MQRGHGGGFSSNSKNVGLERGPGPSHSPGGVRVDLKRDGLKQRAEMQPHLRGAGEQEVLLGHCTEAELQRKEIKE